MKDLIEQRLNELIPKQEGVLFEAAAYSLLAPAKRLRPLLLLAGCQAYSIDPKRALDCACALEMIHTYSLIHDDLPAMDDDDMRRGRPTLHKVYDEALAILAGDFLLTYAFEVLVQAPSLTSEEKVALVRLLAKASGGHGMVGGQVLDLQQDPNIERMHQQKTAALFCFALQSVAILNGGRDAHILETFGYTLGHLFQLLDDLLDHDSPEGEALAFKKACMLYTKCEELLSSLSVRAEALSKHLVQLGEKLTTLQPVC